MLKMKWVTMIAVKLEVFVEAEEIIPATKTNLIWDEAEKTFGLLSEF